MTPIWHQEHLSNNFKKAVQIVIPNGIWVKELLSSSEIILQMKKFYGGKSNTILYKIKFYTKRKFIDPIDLVYSKYVYVCCNFLSLKFNTIYKNNIANRWYYIQNVVVAVAK